MSVPTDLHYTRDHEWVRVDGEEATVGITQYAADQLGDIVFVELPEAGRQLDEAKAFGVVESVKAVSDLFAPLSGEVTAVNDALSDGSRTRQQRPLRRGLDDQAAGRRGRPARRPARRSGLRRPRRRGLSTAMPYGPHTDADRQRMLAALGIDSVDALFADIPEALRATTLDLPEPEPELELAARLRDLAGRNRTDLVSFLGAGVYRHWSPPAVDQLLLRGEWYTAYTPYQPEVSQGTLQSIYEYESLLAELVDLDVVSASHYDGAAATAEAALMTCRATRRERVLVSRGVHPHYRATLRTYFGGGLELDEIPLVTDGDAAGTTDLAALETMLADTDRPVAGVVAANPDFLGLLEPMPRIGELAHAAGALFVAVIEPVIAGRAGAARCLRGGHRGGRGPAAGHRAAVRRAVPRDPGLDRCARPPDPGPARGHDHGPRRPAGLRHDPARPRAGHPARQGGQQHLHQPGPARPGRVHLPRRDRPARAARRGGQRRGARCGARGGPGRDRRAAPPRRVRTSTSSRSAYRTPGRSTAGCIERGFLAGLVLADAEPDDPSLADGLLLCTTELTTVGDIARFVAAVEEVLVGRPAVGVEAGAGAGDEAATAVGARR